MSTDYWQSNLSNGSSWSPPQTVTPCPTYWNIIASGSDDAPKGCECPCCGMVNAPWQTQCTCRPNDKGQAASEEVWLVIMWHNDETPFDLIGIFGDQALARAACRTERHAMRNFTLNQDYGDDRTDIDGWLIPAQGLVYAEGRWVSVEGLT